MTDFVTRDNPKAIFTLINVQDEDDGTPAFLLTNAESERKMDTTMRPNDKCDVTPGTGKTAWFVLENKSDKATLSLQLDFSGQMKLKIQPRRTNIDTSTWTVQVGSGKPVNFQQDSSQPAYELDLSEPPDPANPILAKHLNVTNTGKDAASRTLTIRKPTQWEGKEVKVGFTFQKATVVEDGEAELNVSFSALDKVTGKGTDPIFRIRSKPPKHFSG